MDTLKEWAVDLLILLAGLVIVTAEGISERGLSCGGNQVKVAAEKP